VPINIVFRKTGKEIKAAIQKRLDARNHLLDEFLRDTKKVRSYLIRNTQPDYAHRGQSGYILYSKDDISSEDRQEIAQLCRRIFQIEQELHRLSLIAIHLQDDQVFDLSFNDLIGYGFDATLESE